MSQMRGKWQLLNATLFVVILTAALVNTCAGHIKPGQDCYKDFEGRRFRRLDSTLYTCWPKFKYIFTCYPGSAIPVWYNSGFTSPCLCIQVYSNVKGKKAHICPAGGAEDRRSSPQGQQHPDPNDLGYNTASDMEQTTPGSHHKYIPTTSATPGTTTECPRPFHEMRGFKRVDTDASFSLALGPEGVIHGHLLTNDQNQCLQLCLALDHCRALQFNPVSSTDKRGFCGGFTDFGNRDTLSPSKDTVYFIRRGCYAGPTYTEVLPSTTAVVSLAKGPVFQYMQQEGGEKVLGLEGGEEQCRNYCHDNKDCVAVDYNMHSHECWWHRTTSCTAHTPASNLCCNHYKKTIRYC